MNAIREFIFRVRYALHFRKITYTSFAFGWSDSGAWVEGYGIEECGPIEAAEESFEAWKDSQ